MAAMEWVGETWRTYVGNATSVRDFRVQMRGSKTILAWSIYLIVLLLVSYAYYVNAIQQQSYNSSPAELQSQLRSLFNIILNTVAGAITLIAPGLTAASIVGERQRKSFDLVFSAPVTPKYFLVGKMIGSYRYTLMLLVLTIPVLGLTSLLGGATWGDIAACYFLLSTNALVLTSIALVVSAIVEKVQPAVATSYVLVALYVLATLTIAGVVLATSMGPWGGGGGPVGEKPFLATLNPFMVYEFYGTYTTIAHFKVPNWILNAVYTVAFVRLALLGAGSALSPHGSSERKSLRIQGVLYLLALTLLFFYFPTSTVRASGSGFFVSIILLLVLLMVPWIVAWGESGRRVTTNDGAFNIKKVFIGSPAGAAPYLGLLIIAVLAGAYWVANKKAVPAQSVTAHLCHGIGVLTFFAGLTRWFCAQSGYARGKVFSNLVIIGMNLVMPLFLLVAIASTVTYGAGPRFDQRIEWMAWPMWPIAADLGFTTLYLYGTFTFVAGALFWWRAERRALELRTHLIKPPEWQFENR